MSGQIRFATVSDSRSVTSVFEELPESTPVYCCDTWTLTKSKSGATFNGGLIFFFERDTDVVLEKFERARLCRVWQPRDDNDKNCIFVAWDKEASEEKHHDNKEIVKSIVDDLTKVFAFTQAPVVTDKETHSFISFKQGRGYVPSLLGGLNAHPLLQGCSFKFANRRPASSKGPEIVRTGSEMISHGNFNAQPKRIMTRRNKVTSDE